MSRARGGQGDLRLGYSWAPCTMLLPAPLVWEHSFVWLLPVFAYVISRGVAQWVVLVLGVLFILLAIPLPLFGRMLGLVTRCPLWILVGVLVVRSATVPFRGMRPNTVRGETNLELIVFKNKTNTINSSSRTRGKALLRDE